MRTLILLRHAKAVPPKGVEDFDRQLADRGRLSAPLVGSYLRENDLIPQMVLVSSAQRTRETYGLVAAAAGLPAATFRDDLYLASAGAIRRMIRATPARTNSLMIIGHNPGIADLTQRLADHEESEMQAVMRAAAKFPTAGLAIFSILTPWSEVEHRDGALLKFVTPAQLGGEDED